MLWTEASEAPSLAAEDSILRHCMSEADLMTPAKVRHTGGGCLYVGGVALMQAADSSSEPRRHARSQNLAPACWLPRAPRSLTPRARARPTAWSVALRSGAQPTWTVCGCTPPTSGVASTEALSRRRAATLA
jgi:hypothetical protein